MNADEAKSALEAERKSRITACAAAIEAALAAHKCRLQPVITLVDGQVLPALNIVAEQ